MDLLMVAPCFPPDNMVGAVRMGSLARFLRSENVNIVVLKEKRTDLSESLEGITYIEFEPVSRRSSLFAFYARQRQYRKIVEQLLDSYKFSCALLSGGPFYTFDLACVFRRADLPFVVDYRDPWLFDTRETLGLKPKLLQHVKRILFRGQERRLFEFARYVTTVTDAWADTFRSQYPIHCDKVVEVYNGYDDELMPELKGRLAGNSSNLLLGVFGKLFYYSPMYSDILLDGLNRLACSPDILQVGTREDDANSILLKHGYSEDKVTSTGFVDYCEGLRILDERVDALVVVDSRPHAIGTKIYDYLYLRKPILYIGPKNTDLAKLVASYAGGAVCSTPSEVADAVSGIEALQKTCILSVDVEEYARSKQNKKFYKLLKQAMEVGAN